MRDAAPGQRCPPPSRVPLPTLVTKLLPSARRTVHDPNPPSTPRGATSGDAPLFMTESDTVDRTKFVTMLFDRLWSDYRQRVPHAQRYVDLVTERGGRVVNDHIAFRSLNVPQAAQPAGIDALLNVFLPLGYTEFDRFEFPETHLRAVHLEPPAQDLPKLFISQLQVAELPPELAQRIEQAASLWDESFTYPQQLLAALEADALHDADHASAADQLADLFRRPWLPPPRNLVLDAHEHSQYAAWTLLHGNAVNHFTGFINAQNVPAWPDIQATVDGLRAAGVPMKDTIEGGPDSGLRQSSTRAAEGDFPVTEPDGAIGQLHWTYAYYELAERALIPDGQGGQKYFPGFAAHQTTGLFEMTRTQR